MCLSSCPLSAQQVVPTGEPVLSWQDSTQLKVAFSVAAGDVEITSDDRLILTPRLTTKAGDTLTLPPVELAGHKVVKVTDYKKPEETGLPAANVLIYTLENGATVVVRPSGTEPKIKTYFTTLGKNLAEAQAQKDALAAAIEPILK